MTIKYSVFGKPGNLEEFADASLRKSNRHVDLEHRSGGEWKMDDYFTTTELIAKSGEDEFLVDKSYGTSLVDIDAMRVANEMVVDPYIELGKVKAGERLMVAGMIVHVDTKPFAEFREDYNRRYEKR